MWARPASERLAGRALLVFFWFPQPLCSARDVCVCGGPWARVPALASPLIRCVILGK